MRKIFAFLFIFAIASLGLNSVFAQRGALRYADTRMQEGEYKAAAIGYEEAFKKKPSHRAALGAAEAYGMLRDYAKVYQYRKAAFEQGGSAREDALRLLAAANQAGQKDEVFRALDSLGKFPSSPISHLHLDSLRKWYAGGANAELLNANDYNSSSADFGITMDAGGNTYFSSDRGAEGNVRKKSGIRFDRSSVYYNKSVDFTGRNFFGIYRVDADGGNPTKLTIPVPDAFHASDPTFLPSKSIVFYTVTRKVKSKGDYTVYPEIFYSTIDENGKLSGFTSLPFNNALQYAVITPYVDADAKRLYFASNMAGGLGGYDLYYSEFDDNLTFSAPVNIGAGINTTGNERDPYIHGGKFYFSSDGHIGLGGLDIFETDLRGLGASSKVRNMRMPINSAQDDLKIFKTPDASVFVASNRTQGIDNIYLMKELFKKLQASVVGCDDELVTGPLEVVISDKRSKEIQQVTTGGDGKFTASLAPEADFTVSIKKEGYFTYTDGDLSTRSVQGEGMEKRYKIVRIPYEAPVYTDLLYYNFDQSVIRKDAEPILEKIAELLKSYSFIDISVESHTDARASDAYNQALSERRANAVRDFLSQHGISRSRVKAKWHGKSQLINDCGDGVPCPEQDHQLNRRSELVLYAFPEVGKAYDMPQELKDVDLCEPSNLQIPRDMPVIYFGFDRSDLSAADKQALERVVLMLRHMVNQRLQITGHTDSRGSAEYNEKLSEKRALVVKSYLERRGIDSERMIYDFFGKLKPINDCQEVRCSEAMHSINRRTELSLPELNGGWSKGGDK